MKHIFKIQPDGNRIFGLDILRTFAILFVVYGHGGLLLPESIRKFTNVIVFDGVTIFFVLSGFLIGGILIKTLEKEGVGRSVLFNFWIRRWFRTIPNYMLILMILCVFNSYYNHQFIIQTAAPYFIFSQNLFLPHPDFFHEAWSLSIEEWFYLTVPILIFALVSLFRLNPKMAILATAILVIMATTSFRYIRYENIVINDPNDWDLLFRKQVSTRLDSLMYGVIGAYVAFYNKNAWLRFKTPLLVVGIVLLIVARLLTHYCDYASLYACVFSFSIISLATLLMLPFLSDLRSGKGWLYRSITCISLISYSMYLLNLSIIQRTIIANIEWSVISDTEWVLVALKYIVYWLLTVGLSILLYKYFEVPMTKLRDHTKLKTWISTSTKR